MTFAPGQSGNPAGSSARKRARTAAVIHRDVRRNALRTIGENSVKLFELGVQRALAGNSEALSGCLAVLASLAGKEEPKRPDDEDPAKNSQQDRRGAES